MSTAEQAPPDGRELVQRTGGYVLVRDESDRVLLVRASPRSDLAGRWFLPGGGLRHGEAPALGAQRELLEETGLDLTAPLQLREAVADVIDLPHRGCRVHTVRLIYQVRLPAAALGQLRPEPDGTSDQVRLVPASQLAQLPLMPFVARLLDQPVEQDLQAHPPVRPEPLIDAEAPAGPGRPPRRQRPAAYAALLDRPVRHPGEIRTARILLTRLSGADLWTLPGGGIDHGEQPVQALVREMHEETGLPYQPGPLLSVDSSHFTGRAPNGQWEDFHGIRLVYGGAVPVDRTPQVTEVGGSTEQAAWFPVAQLNRIRVSALVNQGLKLLEP